MDETTLALTFWAQLFTAVGCIGIVLVIMFCVTRDAIREYRDRRDERERLQSLYKTHW